MIQNHKRLAFNIALILSLLYLPWWAGAVIVVSACFLVENFYEAVLYGIISDVLYGTAQGWHGLPYASTIFAAAVFLVASTLRKRMAW
ncbi:MAG TPA: hypothetical protein VFQ72_02845 [Candidatus Paceibacterota bacterium]|nr:hypothetical protein [Candidatus Paceibacterota bacterium]